MNRKETRLTITQKNKLESLLAEYNIIADREFFQIIRDLKAQLMSVDFFFSLDRGVIERDNKRIVRIIKIVNQFENQGLKADFFDTISLSFKYKFTLPANNEDIRHIIQHCGVIHQVLESRGYFKRAKESRLYPFLASLVNILRDQRTFSDDVLNDGEVKAFKKFLGKSPFTKREK